MIRVLISIRVPNQLLVGFQREEFWAQTSLQI